MGISSFTVSANAASQVQRLGGYTGAPFIVCADGLQKDLNFMGTPGGSNGILDFSSDPPTIRSQAIYANGGPDFLIHGSKVGQNDGDCGWGSGSSYKGVADETYACSTLPCWFPFDNGTKAGPIRTRVAGYDGCQSTTDSDAYVNGCVVVLPIAARQDSAGDTCSGSTPSNNMCIRAWAAFQIYSGDVITGAPSGCNDSNCHIGRLLGQVLVTEGTGTTWTPGANAPVVLRLTQ